MAGHRDGRTRRQDARRERMLRRLTTARTAEEQLAAAFDWFRMSARRLPDGERTRQMRDMSQSLAARATEIDRSL